MRSRDLDFVFGLGALILLICLMTALVFGG